MILKRYLLLPFVLLVFFQGGTPVYGSKKDILGVNVLGLKAGINTNLFSKDGPIAKAVDDLTSLKKKSDNFWNNVAENTSNFFNKVGSSLTGSWNGDSSATGSLSLGGGAQGSLSESESSNGASVNGAGANLKITLKEKSTGSSNELSSGSSSGSVSTGSTGGGSGTVTFNLPNIDLNDKSQNVRNQDSTNLDSSSGSGSVNFGGSGRISLPTIVIDGGSSDSHKTSVGSYTWSWKEGSGSSPSDTSHWTLSKDTGSQPKGLSAVTWRIGNVSNSNTGAASSEGSSANGSPVLNIEGSSGSRSGDSSTDQKTSAWSLGGLGRSSFDSGFENLRPTTWSLNGGGSGSISVGSPGNVGTHTVILGGGSGSNSGSTSGQSSLNSGSSESAKWTLSGQSGGQISNGNYGGENSGKDSSASPSGNLVGVNVLGLKAGFCTNLFDEDGPLAKAGENLKNILEGKKLTNLNDLNNILGVNIGDMKADLTTNLFGNGKASNAKGEQEILGKSVLGFHEGLNTNIISNTGPLAKVGNDIKNLLEGKVSLGDLMSGKGSAASSNQDLVGVNALGVKLALCTNLFDKDGPLAKAGADVDSFFKTLGDNNAKMWANLRNFLGGGSA